MPSNQQQCCNYVNAWLYEGFIFSFSCHWKEMPNDNEAGCTSTDDKNNNHHQGCAEVACMQDLA
jgi:hypothetical protein